MSKRAVFLDRDGVINRAIVRDGKPYPPETLEELEILPGVLEALGRLREAGFHLIVVTNQPDVARGVRTRDDIESFHNVIQTKLPLDDFRVCYHDDGDSCGCRKPEPGLLIMGAQENNVELSASFMVGDRWRDVEAAQRAGCIALFIDYNYTEQQPSKPFIRIHSLYEAADWILSQEDKTT